MPDPRRKNWSQADILKYEVAAELGLLEKVLARGWAGLSTAESGRIGGIVGKRLHAHDDVQTNAR
nr:small, acid-soluble spore protein, alpha/beta type [Maliibacterium massiliense]